MKKIITSGILVGLLLGIMLPLFFPNLLVLDLLYKMEMNRQLGFPPDYYSPKGGGILAGSGLFLIILGIIGGLIGFLLAKILKLIKS